MEGSTPPLLSIDAYAMVLAGLHAGASLRRACLNAAVEQEAWEPRSREWDLLLEQNDAEAASAYDLARIAADEKYAPRVEPIETDATSWAMFRRHFIAAPNPTLFLSSRRMDVSTYARIEELWSDRSLDDVEISRALKAAMARPLGDCPPLWPVPSKLLEDDAEPIPTPLDDHGGAACPAPEAPALCAPASGVNGAPAKHRAAESPSYLRGEGPAEAPTYLRPNAPAPEALLGFARRAEQAPLPPGSSSPIFDTAPLDTFDDPPSARTRILPSDFELFDRESVPLPFAPAQARPSPPPPPPNPPPTRPSPPPPRPSPPPPPIPPRPSPPPPRPSPPPSAHYPHEPIIPLERYAVMFADSTLLRMAPNELAAKHGMSAPDIYRALEFWRERALADDKVQARVALLVDRYLAALEKSAGGQTRSIHDTAPLEQLPKGNLARTLDLSPYADLSAPGSSAGTLVFDASILEQALRTVLPFDAALPLDADSNTKKPQH